MSKVRMLSIDESKKQELTNAVRAMQGRRILVCGDVGLDEYILGEVRKISPEAPVPVLEVEKEDLRLGLSGNVAQNIVGLGGTPLLVSVMGTDSGADLLRQLLKRQSISDQYLVAEKERPTTRKARVMAKHHHLVRVDYELKKFISDQTEKTLIKEIEGLITTVDSIVIEDYFKGVVSENLLQSVIAMARSANKPVYVDPTRHNRAEFYKGADLLKPNFDEAVSISGLSYDDLRHHPNKVFEVGEALLAKSKVQALVITQGKEGMTIFTEGAITQVPTYARQVFDVTGAGDTVIATLAMALSSGIALNEACMLANFAAGVVVGQVGSVPCTSEELTKYIQSH